MDAGSAGLNRGERPAVVLWRFRLGIKSIEVTGAAPEPDHKHRPRVGWFRRNNLCQRRETERCRNAEPGPQKGAPVHPPTTRRPETAHVQHGVSLLPFACCLLPWKPLTNQRPL